MHADDCTCRAHPLPATMRVQEARDAYLAENGFTLAAYDDPWTQASFFGLAFSVPNTRKHRWAIKLHDLHHVATGYGTDLIGEAEVSAWEARGGLWAVGPYVGAIVASIIGLGALVWPRRTLRAFRGSTGAPALWTRDADYDALMAMTVGELRALLGVPRDGLAPRARALHPRAPKGR